ncbi:peptide chain release factor 1 [Anncaliia algerae PRA339]|uniref:Peptide chain release factor 1 n=1 Tax=Anncaliia algerae PRA339 TaxID=1288291 RepID=A0A059EXT0_9MICR|nr:peptide chain release factor 1 [Anncaliia algerae PRA339]
METEYDEVEMWRTRKLLLKLRDSKGNGTSMISLIIPPKEQISKTQRMLVEEYGTATNIKSRVNRLSVLSAITSAQQKLKTYNRIPDNGLAIFVGTIVEQNKDKKISIGITPLKPINTSLYLCDSKFHVESLLALFENEERFGFVIMDGHSTIFANVEGNVKTILQKVCVDLPRKHGRGGQSSLRFARIRLEKRHNYVKKIAEICTALFISNDKMNVEGLILGGHSDFKNDLKVLLDQRLKVLKIVDTNYGEENGLNEAIELSLDILKDVKFSKEKKVLQDFFAEISQDGRFVFSYDDTIKALEMGAVETLIVYENCKIEHESQPFVDFIAENYKQFSCSLIFVGDKSPEGAQFIEGFGGIGGILRYKIEIEEDLESLSDEDFF